MSEQIQDTSPRSLEYLANIRGKIGERLTWRNAARTIGGAALFAIPSAAVAGGIAYKIESRDTTIASFDSTVHLANDGYVTFDAEPLSSVRIPANQSMNLGINVELGESRAPNKAVLYSEAAAIAAQPKGEIDKISEATRSLLIDVAGSGAAGGIGGIMLFSVIGARRRHELTERYGSKAARIVVVGALATACTASSPAPVMPDSSHDIKWHNIQDVFPNIPSELADKGIQVDSNVVSDEAFNLIRGMIAGYERSAEGYKEAEQKASELGPELRQPGPGEITMLLMADRHDNIGMDPINAAIGKAGHADVVIDAGDDTSSGEAWEEFSLASLVANFKDYKYRLGIAGNHDSGFVTTYLSEANNGFTMLDHNSVMIEGIRIMGFGDIRSSSMVNSESYATTDLTEYKEQIVEEACDADANGERPTIILTHQASLAEDALRAGCADLVGGGHLHVFKGPTEFTADNGNIGYSITTDTAGGAALAMALGPLRRSAGVTLITFDISESQPKLVGFQKVVTTQYHDVYALPFESVVTSKVVTPTQLKHDKVYPTSTILTEKRRTQN